MKALINASMRGAEMGHLADQIGMLEAAGIDSLHFDIKDGHFGSEVSFGPIFVRGLRSYTKLPFDVHLELANPQDCFDSYIEAGADSLVIHIEVCPDPSSLLSSIRAKGCASGLAINPATPTKLLEPYLGLCDQINVMTVPPGVPGELDEQGVENIREVAGMIAGLADAPIIQADGAVSLKTRELLVAAGAVSLVSGYPIFSRSDIETAIAELRTGRGIK